MNNENTSFYFFNAKTNVQGTVIIMAHIKQALVTLILLFKLAFFIVELKSKGSLIENFGNILEIMSF